MTSNDAKDCLLKAYFWIYAAVNKMFEGFLLLWYSAQVHYCSPCLLALESADNAKGFITGILQVLLVEGVDGSPRKIVKGGSYVSHI